MNRLNKKIYLIFISASFYIYCIAQGTQGFFIDNYKCKTVGSPAFIEYNVPNTKSTVLVSINDTDTITEQIIHQFVPIESQLIHQIIQFNMF